MNKEKIVKDSIELVKRFDNMSNSDCEDEGVVSSEFGTIGVGVFAALRDCYFNGYSSNKDVSNKEVFTDEEIEKARTVHPYGYMSYTSLLASAKLNNITLYNHTRFITMAPIALEMPDLPEYASNNIKKALSII